MATAVAVAMFVPLVAPFDPGVVAAPVGQGFELNASDLRFILQQISIAERHVAETTSATGPCGALFGADADQIPAGGVGVTLPWGLRTVDGSCNNIVEGLSQFGTADENFPRIVEAEFRAGYEPSLSPSSMVFDDEPRVISNLIVDQTETNPVIADMVNGDTEIAPSGAVFIPNVATDTGLSAPYNSWFTLFGQFFDHGLDLVNKGGAGTVVITLDSSDPLYEVGAPNMMFLTRATHVGGEANNQTSPFVDQSQTYTSHPSHQVFLREYASTATGAAAVPGSLIEGVNGGMATWAEVKEQAATELGITLQDIDVTNIPLLLTDPYGNFIPGDAGFPQVVFPNLLTIDPNDTELHEGNPLSPISVVGSLKTNHAFLDDIAHHAAPGGGKVADEDVVEGDTSDDHDPTTYDDEMLAAHFIAGDGRVNENIGLTTVHHVFHSEHNRLAEEIDLMITNELTAAEEAAWRSTTGPSGWDYTQRVFQAARFVTEMEYQHLVFEEFARKVQPMVNLFGEGGTGYHPDLNPAITAEFAHAVYRFGHSMLTETVDRTLPDGTASNMDLLAAFLNPPAFWDDATSADNAAGNVVRGMTRQVGNELDEFITEAVRNRLLGLPLDLAALNIARGRDTGVPTLNAARRAFYAQSGDTSLQPYTSWIDFGFNLKHEGSLVNFIAAYGTHSTIDKSATAEARRAAAQALIDAAGGDPLTDPIAEDALAFLESTGIYADVDGITTTGVDDIDLWAGGLAEKQIVFGGLLGPTFNYVFEIQMENLQDGDRFYYLSRTAGLNLLTQLEGNSFSELVQRNTDVSGLPADSFSYPACIFNMAFQNTTGPILDDPNTDCFENDVLVRTGGTIRYTGAEHVVFNGVDTEAGKNPNDNLRASEGDDTMRGNAGNDRLEGGDGNDNLIGGEGDDILTDLAGDETIKGGPGNDVISSGRGFGGDLNQGGTGDDFVIGGNDMTETFGGAGDDVVYAGDAEDTVFGDEGNDWVESGQGPFALMQGDSGAPFQDDPNEPGHDVLMGYGGEQDYDAEGGDDIMFAGPGIQRSEGMLGFDWVTHRGDPVAGDSDMLLTALQPVAVDVNKDRFDLVEALSGWDRADVLKGDDRDSTTLVGHELTQEGIDRITGLADVLPGGAPFSGGNIILGGAGSDIIEGRGGDDLIDGDRWLNAQLVAPHPVSGLPVHHNSLGTLRADVLAGRTNPGAIDVDRFIVDSGDTASVDTAVFSDLLENYTIVKNDDGTVTVAHVLGTVTDGTDTLRNVERLLFADGDIILGVLFNTTATGTLVIDDQTPAENQLLSVAVNLIDPDGIPATVDDGLGNPVDNVLLEWQVLTSPGTWEFAGTGETFTPDDAQVGFPLRVVAYFVDNFGVSELVFGDATTGVVTNVNDGPVGEPVIDNTTPIVGDTLTVDTSLISDEDGLPAVLDIQWLANGAEIPGETGVSFVPTNANENDLISVRVSFIDLRGAPESVVSLETAPVFRPAAPELTLGSASLAFGTRARLTAPTSQVILVTNTGNAALTVAPATVSGTGAASFTLTDGCSIAPVAPSGTCTIGVVFLTTAAVGVKSATVTINSDDPAAPHTVPLTGTLVNNVAATGAPVVNDTTPIEGQLLTASQGTIADANGITTSVFGYQWQQNSIGGADAVYTSIPGATLAQFTPGEDQANRRLRVVATFTDDHGTVQTRTSAATQVVGDVFLGGTGADLWVGTAQIDNAFGGDGNDTLSALAGNDIIAGNGDDDTILAGAGNDTIQFSGTGDGFDNVDGGTNTDTIVALSNGTVIGLRGLSLVEVISAGVFTGVSIGGSADPDTLNFSATTLTGITFIDSGAGNDAVTGNGAANVIRGGADNDTILGNGGVDTITGGSGNDAINAGAGNDFIIYAPGDGADTVTGFDSGPPGGQDRLNITAFGVTAATFAANVGIAPSGADTLVTVGGVTILLIGIAPASITAADFLLL